MTLTHTSSRDDLISWPATLAALTAFLTLMLTVGLPLSGSGLILLFLMGALLTLRLTGFRLPEASWAHWAVRLPLGGLIVLMNWNKLNDPNTWLFDTTAVGAFGMLAAAEFVIQAARTLPPDESNSAALFLLSGFTFLSACTTDLIAPVRIAAPIYFAFVVFSLPRFGTEAHRTEDGQSLRRRSLAVLAALVLGASTYFLFWTFRVPLMQIGASAIRDHPPEESTGLSSQPTLGPTFGQHGSFQRVLRLTGSPGAPYLRGLAYDTYRGGRWGPRPERASYVSVRPNALHPEDNGARLAVTTLANVRGIIFVPLATTGLRVSIGEDTVLRQDPMRGMFRTSAPLPEPYLLVFGPAGRARLVSSVLTDEARERDLHVPSDIDPRVRSIALSLTRGADTPAEKTAAIQNYLFTHYRYSLTVDPGSGDPVSNFILGRKAAHCEFFASAAVILLRCAGIPARYATGYYAHESDSEGATVVRQQDAHAWAEAWIAPSGWETVDATPADGRPSRTAERLPLWRRAIERIGDEIAALRAWLGQFTTGQILAALTGVIVVVMGLRWLWRRWRERPAANAAFAYAQASGMDALATRYANWLRHIGAACPPEMTWQEHARLVKLREAEAFVTNYNAARFGLPVSPRAIAALEAQMRQLEKAAPTRAAAVKTAA